MTVKDLKDKLDTLDENLQVFGYSYLEEGGGGLCGARVETEFPHCGGDIPDNLPDSFVVIYSD
jgi:hypothetical protein